MENMIKDLQDKYDFVHVPFPLNNSEAFKKGESVFVGAAEKLKKLRISVHGLIVKIPQDVQTRDIENYNLIGPFWYDCLQPSPTGLEDDSIVMIKNNLEVTDGNNQAFLYNLGLDCKNDIFNLENPPPAPDHSDIQF